jgi:PAS domain S-box-containing protein
LKLDKNSGLGNPIYGREQLLQKIVEGVRDYAIFLLDPKGYILSWNKVAEKIKGFREEEVLGKHFSIFYGEEDIANAKPRQALSVALKEGRFAEEGWRVRKDGSRFWASVVVTPIYDDNGINQGFVK